MNKAKLLPFVFFLILSFLVIFPASVYASILDNLLNDAKNLITQEEDKNIKNKSFTLESAITLAPGGDANNNGEIDAGDIVRFTYTLQNTTDKKYSFGTLETNIDRKEFNFFHNLNGTNNLVDDDKTIKIANVRIDAGETLIMSFDARTLYREDDKSITTDAEFFDSDKKSVLKAAKIEKLVKKNMPSFIPGIRLEKN